MSNMKRTRRDNLTRLTAKNQATIPVAAVKRAGLKPGDELQVETPGAGRIILTRVDAPLAAYAGRLTGVYRKRSLKKIRREWR